MSLVEACVEALPEQFETELNLPAHGLRSGQLAKRGVSDGERSGYGRGQQKRGRIAGVERFGAELKRGSFGGAELLKHREVEVAGSWAAKDGSTGIAEGLDGVAAIVRHLGRDGEGRGIEILIEPGFGTRTGWPRTRSGRFAVLKTGGFWVTRKSVGKPLRRLRMPFTCQPPRTWPTMPLWFRKRLPGPKGRW